MKKALLAVEGLEVVYHTDAGTLPALSDVRFEVRQGQIVGVVGESGCGKSTLGSALLRLLPPNGEIVGGRVMFAGRDLARLSPGELRGVRGQGIATVFQDPLTSLNPTFTVGQQMIDAQRAHQRARAPKAALRSQAIEALTRVGIPDAAQRIDHHPHEFSGGMRQRIMIAIALLHEPALLIADEATSALDVTLEAQILKLLKEVNAAHGTAILLISHNLGVIAEVCERVVVMYAGRAVEEGDVYSIFDRPLHPYTRALLAAVPSPQHRGTTLAAIPGRVPSLLALPPGCKYADRCDHAVAVCFAREPLSIEVAGSRVRCFLYADGLPEAEETARGLVDGAGVRMTPNATSVALLIVRDLQTHFSDRQGVIARLLRRKAGKVRAVDGVSFEVVRGETLGLVGESGSGKSTLARTVMGLAPATGGSASLDGRELLDLGRREWRPLRRRMQMIFQDPVSSLSPRFRVSFLLREPYVINRVPPDQQSSVDELLEMVGLSSEQAGKYPHELSGGQARRVSIARALALHPEVLFADEPTAGLDVSAAASILNLMRNLRDRLGLTYVLITHDLNVVGYFADRIAVMYVGQLVEIGLADRILAHPRHPYTHALLACAPVPDPHLNEGHLDNVLGGEIPSPRDPPSGCRFHPRCAYADQRCTDEVPQLEDLGEGEMVACHHWRRIDLHGQPPATPAVAAAPT